jgi:lipid-A-disaccharide synthase
MKPSILFVTGEVSGDMIAANLATTIRAIDPEVKLVGVGGGHMNRVGVGLLFNSNPFGSAGVTESFATMPGAIRALGAIRGCIRRERPKVAVLIGNEFFNPLLARWLRGNGIPTIAYFPPQVWIWRGLAGVIARSYDCIFTSFAEEHEVYRRAGGQVIFVGHFLRDLVEEVSAEGRRRARQALGLNGDGPIMGVLPGSRKHEVQRLGPLLLDAVRRIRASDPSCQFVLPIADPCFEPELLHMIRAHDLIPCIQLCRDSRLAMAASEVVLMSSGTATLEAALLGIPMVIFYRVSRLTWSVVRTLVRTGLMESDTMGLPNLISREPIVPELRQSQALSWRLANEALSILHDEVRQTRMRERLRNLTGRLGEKGATVRVARAILEKAWE